MKIENLFVFFGVFFVCLFQLSFCLFQFIFSIYFVCLFVSIVFCLFVCHTVCILFVSIIMVQFHKRAKLFSLELTNFQLIFWLIFFISIHYASYPRRKQVQFSLNFERISCD